ncbi:hypothetical protein LBWT_27140 [Leptolyngbya boryana IAM M-101]|nr:DUF4365 domain-containing protein [Leptolyngbya sp. FACHB-161]MBD2373433.1 DUF4365 domain-containing protein [Leptolyngbya sp. FACHB-238]MBD2397842.1 DUF4365 domain-containing protein [Leptolyngbya sp. FACHB-239]MBD2404343.1 DUF4365 domain-containing protein [Leptolyngbya sp. FACHB-402]BAS56789.1 hypothetical protein LBWT_27140 [Leptolyngbya boryana IAM M-101]BAS63137.1 hypothetical protein LBDG_27140 [Leptolyngbya boryana dg5]
MHTSTRKEEFSYAYVHAIASTAGFCVQPKSRPMDSAGLDIIIEAPGAMTKGVLSFPKIEAQVKCTATKANITELFIKFPLEVKNYNKLRLTSHLVPQILIVVLVPEILENWIEITEPESTVIRKCAYWLSLKGKEETLNDETITVSIPRSNLLTPESLTELMSKVAHRQDL